MDKLTLKFSLIFGFWFLVSAAASAAVPDGYVVRVESSTVYLDWGTASGVQAGDRFDVYREGDVLKHPVTGAILGHARKTVGMGRVENVDAKFAIGHMDSVEDPLRVGDRSHWTPMSMTVAEATAA